MIDADARRAGRRARRDPGRRPPPPLRLRAGRGRPRTRSSTRRSSSAATSSSPTTRAASRCRACASRSSGRRASSLEGKDPHGEDVRYELEGYGARVVQHELDHLDGVLIIDRTDDEHRKEALSDAAAPRRASVMRIGVAATAPIGADVLERLAETHEIAFLLTRPDAPQGRGRKRRAAAGEAGRRPARHPGAPAGEAGAARGGRPRRRLRVRPLHPAAPARALALAERASRRCCRAGAAPRRSSARSSPATSETGVTIHETVAELDAGPIAAREAFDVGDLDAGAGVRALGRGRGAAARRGDRVADVRAAGRGRRRRTPRRSAPPTASSTSTIRSMPGAASARSRRTSARGRRCTAGA